MITKTKNVLKRQMLFYFLIVSLSSCYSFKVATIAQEGTDPVSIKTRSFFWGFLPDPPTISTPLCDSLGSLGMSEVKLKRTFGNSFVTLITLGIYCPATLEYRCSKPCPKIANPL